MQRLALGIDQARSISSGYVLSNRHPFKVYTIPLLNITYDRSFLTSFWTRSILTVTAKTRFQLAMNFLSEAGEDFGDIVGEAKILRAKLASKNPNYFELARS